VEMGSSGPSSGAGPAKRAVLLSSRAQAKAASHGCHRSWVFNLTTPMLNLTPCGLNLMAIRLDWTREVMIVPFSPSPSLPFRCLFVCLSGDDGPLGMARERRCNIEKK
jgi:hypothetical protein